MSDYWTCIYACIYVVFLLSDVHVNVDNTCEPAKKKNLKHTFYLTWTMIHLSNGWSCVISQQ